MPEKNNQTILGVEKDVNNVLHKIVFIVTILSMGMMLVGFFSRGDFPPSRISAFYIGVLLIYSLHKEALRWLEEKQGIYPQRRGEYFVYSWILLTAALYLINFFSKDYFLFSKRGEPLSILNEIALTALEVCTVFIFTRLIKIIGSGYKKDSPR
jgi:hypothetical protein